MPKTISQRKDDHLRIAANKDVQYTDSAGFEDILLIHNALPEVNLKSIDTSTKFLGRTLSAPLLITGMTGGTDKGGAINQKLAKAAEKAKVALGLGSQRPMLKDSSAARHYKVRSLCPSVPLIGNIGAVNLAEYPLEKIEWLISSTEADALAIHLNALQEAIQPEGDTNFSGVLKAVGKVCERLSVPVIVKETGAGISGPVAKRLFDVGVKFVECSGRGGTSWSKVEYARSGAKGAKAASGSDRASVSRSVPGFEEWGYPTIPAIVECASFGPSLCTGGVRHGLDAAKGIALGATLSGAAMPFYRATEPAQVASEWREQMCTAMFLCGAKNLEQMRNAPLIIGGRSAEILQARGFDVRVYASRAVSQISAPSPSERGHYL